MKIFSGLSINYIYIYISIDRFKCSKYKVCFSSLLRKNLESGCKHDLHYSDYFMYFRVRKQVVNVPSFIVRLDSQKHIDFSLKSPFGGGRYGRVKRKNMRKGGGKADDGSGEED